MTYISSRRIPDENNPTITNHSTPKINHNNFEQIQTKKHWEWRIYSYLQDKKSKTAIIIQKMNHTKTKWLMSLPLDIFNRLITTLPSPSCIKNWKIKFAIYISAAVVKVCHVTTTGYSRSLSDKRTLHSRAAVLRYRTVICEWFRHDNSHMSAYRWWYQGYVLTLPHLQPHHICDDIYSAYYQMFSSVVPVAHATRPEYGLLELFLVHWQQGRMRYPFSQLTILHRFFEDLNFHGFLTQ